LDSDTAHLSGTQTFTGAKSFDENATLAGFVLDGNTITGIDDSGEFTDDDAHIMTSAGINDKFGVIAGSSSIVTVGTIGTGTWQGTAIASAYLDSDTAHLSGSQTFSGDKTFSGSITIGGHAFDDIDIGSEFVDTDDHIMSSGAIKEKIEAYGYTTNTGDMTGVDLTVTSPITIGSETNTTSGSYSATLGLDDPANLTELNESTDATDDKILLWDESASSWKYMTLDNLQDSIDTTGGGGGGSMDDLVDDTSPQLGGNLDTNSQNILIDDDHGLLDVNGEEVLLVGATTSANSYIKIWNGISDTAAGTLFGTDVVHTDTAGSGRIVGPGFEATGDQTDVGLSFKAKGLGDFSFVTTDTTNARGPVLNLLRYHTGEADDDTIGLIKFMGPDTSMSSPELHDHRDYAKIRVKTSDVSDGSADGTMYLSTLLADSHTDLVEIGTHPDDDDAAGVALYRGQMLDVSGTTTFNEADHAGRYIRVTSATTVTLPASPGKGEQYVVISDHAGTTTISADGSDTMNGSTNNQTITTRYEAKTFIAVSTSAWIVIG